MWLWVAFRLSARSSLSFYMSRGGLIISFSCMLLTDTSAGARCAGGDVAATGAARVLCQPASAS